MERKSQRYEQGENILDLFRKPRIPAKCEKNVGVMQADLSTKTGEMWVLYSLFAIYYSAKKNPRMQTRLSKGRELVAQSSQDKRAMIKDTLGQHPLFNKGRLEKCTSCKKSDWKCGYEVSDPCSTCIRRKWQSRCVYSILIEKQHTDQVSMIYKFT